MATQVPDSRIEVAPEPAGAALPVVSGYLRRFSVFFFFSGFCGLLYEVIWLRLGMADFGVTTPVVSMFVSIFMGGLGAGSWLGGQWMRRYRHRPGMHALRLYGFCELLIGISALVVPLELTGARHYIENYGGDLAISSLHYYAIAGLWMLAILLPWCLCMGATYPLAMAAIRRLAPAENTSFSLLYVANVLGAIVGALVPAFVLIEIFGFHNTLKIGAFSNGIVFLLAMGLSLNKDAIADAARARSPLPAPPPAAVAAGISARLNLSLLLLTGLVSLAMEMVWIRQFTPYLGTEVYTFAWILGCYLLGTWLGSQVYRLWLRRHSPGEMSWAWVMLGLAGLFPLLLGDPRIDVPKYFRVAMGIMPLTALLGFVTPQLVDQYSDGDPDLAGRAYAVNVVGCILGPLIAAFIFLPVLGEHWSLVVLALPLFAIPFMFQRQSSEARAGRAGPGFRFYFEMAVVSLAFTLMTKDFITIFPQRVVRRDYAATVVATGAGMRRQLVVNGINLTILTPITKYMAHMPLAFLNHAPRNALVICFGMGTTFRSLLSWNIPATAVELLPSVPKLFGYYHSDGPELLQSPNAHMVIDDGRLFLEKSKQQFDVITIDPPPPIWAAGVSFLYSREFYQALKPRLAPGGIMQQWTTGGDWEDFVAIAKAIRQSFPYVRGYVSVEGWGFHFLASDRPIPDYTAAQLAAHLPPAAQADLLEWYPGMTAQQAFQNVLDHRLNLDETLHLFPQVQALDDDRPVNEYHYLRDHLPPRWVAYLYRIAAGRPQAAHTGVGAALRR